MKFELKNTVTNQTFMGEYIETPKRGTMSDQMVIYKLASGYRITPYEFRLRWTHVDYMKFMNFIFKRIYSDSIAYLIPSGVDLLRKIKI